MNLTEKAKWVRIKTLEIHKIAQDTRVASCLSCVEILTALYYGKILKFCASNPTWKERDRFIASKGHGTISLYPILANLGFFSMNELNSVCREGSFLGSIPNFRIPGFETINGSLGHGPGVGCGIAIALKHQNSNSDVVILTGDGELYEGAVWEAVMFAAHNSLDNLLLVIDNNKVSMLDYTKNIVDIEPLNEKFKAFGWEVANIDGHDVNSIYEKLRTFKKQRKGKPKVLIADTVKGKGVSSLEIDSLSHIRSLTPEQIDDAIENL